MVLILNHLKSQLRQKEQMSEWSPLIYGRTYEVDFRLLAVPSDFDTSRKEWALRYIRGMLQSPASLKKNSRWAIFSDDQHCVFGVACQVEKLVNTSERDERQLCKDKAGRSLYVFVGFVTKMNHQKDVNDIPSLYYMKTLNIFKEEFINVILSLWQTRFYKGQEIYDYRKYSYFFSTYRKEGIETNYWLNFCHKDTIFIFPDNIYYNEDLWKSACQLVLDKQPICLGLGFDLPSMIIESPFLNGTIINLHRNLDRRQILHRTSKATFSNEDSEPEHSSTEYSIYEKFIEKLSQYFYLILNKLIECFRHFLRKIFNLSRSRKK